MIKKLRFFGDVVTMTGRCLLLSKRNADTLLTSIAVPALMMLLFTYVLGGAINVGGESYVNYIVPAIILQCMGQCASSTAISVCNDINKGIIDRFFTMPFHKSAILTGHVLEAVLRNFIASFIVIAVALLVGFRPSANMLDWIIVVFILFLYILTISWLSVYFGIKANSPEGAGAFSVLAILIPYISSGFVPVETMPGFLRGFAEHQPITPIVESLRALLLGKPLDRNTLLTAIIWCLVLSTVFFFLSAKAFKRKIRKA